MNRQQSIWHEHQISGTWTKSFHKGSMFDYLRQSAQDYMNSVAIEFEGKKTTYKKLLDQIDVVAKALIANKIKKGDVVSIISINTPQVLMMIYALNRIGAVANMIHPLLSATEIESFIKKTDSVAVLILDQIYPKIAKINWNNEIKPRIVLTRIVDALPLYTKPIYSFMNSSKIKLNSSHNTIYWNDFLASAKAKKVSLPVDDGKEDDLALIMYSGGTTGTPKGVMLTNLNINSYALQAFEVSGIVAPTGKKFLAILPLFHGFGFASGIHANLTQGVHVYLLPKFEFKKSINLIFKEKINFIYAVPALFEALVRSPQIEEKDLSFFECLICGGDKLQGRLYDKLSSYLKKGNAKTVFCEGYGQTECVAACINNPAFAVNKKSVGILLPDIKGKIVEPGTQKEVPNGVDGELCVCGPTVMKGYFKNEEETKEVLKVHEDGRTWLHTGDMFSKDNDGYFYFKQRISRMAISAGYNIYVTQVEKAILTSPVVSQCCVIGVNDKVLGQKIRACVVLNDATLDKNMARDNIMNQCKLQLAEYSLPHEIRFYDELPMTPLGKVDFKALEK